MSFLQVSRRTVRLAAVAIALTISSPSAHAQQPSAAVLLIAKELVATTGAVELFGPLIAGVVEQAKLLLLQQNPNLNKDLTEVANKIRTDLRPRFDELTNEVARLYAAHFSEQELKDVLAFYKSPLGKKVLAEQPKVVEASLKFAQNWANSLSDEVMAKMRNEMKKKGHAL